jgi:GNAT superfamily N-acetyltransferase
MVKELSQPASLGPSDKVIIRPVGLDDWAAVRYVHAAAFRVQAAGHFTASELDAFAGFVRTQDYVDQLIAENIQAAWLDNELVGTSGWIPADDNGALARITAVYVRPFFTRMGIGRKLVLDAEMRARVAGFQRYSARVTFNAVGFFEKLGYDITSYGIQAMTAEQALPITYMRKQPMPETRRKLPQMATDAADPQPEPDAVPLAAGGLLTPRGR